MYDHVVMLLFRDGTVTGLVLHNTQVLTFILAPPSPDT